jgi:hypothetical protein
VLGRWIIGHLAFLKSIEKKAFGKFRTDHFDLFEIAEGFFVSKNSNENLHELVSPDQVPYILAVLEIYQEAEARKESYAKQ